MSETDKVKNAAQKAAGQGEEKAGQVTGDQPLEAEGQRDQAKGDLKDAGEKVKDAFKK